MINLRFDNPAYLWDDGKDGKRFFCWQVWRIS